MHRFQHVAGFLLDSTITHSNNTNGIKNNSITQRDLELSTDILGPSRYISQGKTTRTQPNTVNISLQRVDIPRIIKQFYDNIELSTDIMFLNDVTFLTSILEHIHYGMASAVDNLTCMFLESKIKKVLRSYAMCGF